MKVWHMLIGLALATQAWIAFEAGAETAKRIPSLATRTATCKNYCKTGQVHGVYRSYKTADPTLMSPEGRKSYAECVKLCLAPLPTYNIWSPILNSGGTVYGKTKADCMGCHGAGEVKGRTAGTTMQPDALRRDVNR